MTADTKPATLIHPFPRATALAFMQHRDAMLAEVNRRMEKHPGIRELIGGNTMDTMMDNHRNHVLFMSNVFLLSRMDMLTKTVPWVYHAYSSRGFQFDYFPLELDTWKSVISATLSPEIAEPALHVYDWMLSHHENMIEQSGKLLEEGYTEKDMTLAAEREQFTEALLKGDHNTCLKIGKAITKERMGIEHFYLRVMHPALYRVGRMWQENLISIAQEHLASAIATRVMSAIYSERKTPKHTRGRAMITSAPNEFHEIGAWMVSDLLEEDGWDVRYLGSNTPAKDLLKLIHEFRPHILAVSATMTFNLDRVQNLVTRIRTDDILKSTRIMVGGPAFAGLDGLPEQIGADGYAADATKARDLARSWSGGLKNG